MTTAADHAHAGHEGRYEPPTLVELGTVADLTLSGCFMDKKWFGSDGLKWGNISIPVSSC
jgi:hypothetical protein